MQQHSQDSSGFFSGGISCLISRVGSEGLPGLGLRPSRAK